MPSRLLPDASGTRTNWAGNYRYGAQQVVFPSTVPELQDLVGSTRHVRALGSGHTFTALPDTVGDLVSLTHLPVEIEVDTARRTVRVGGGVLYEQLGRELHQQGWALANTASLPHISVAGAVATGTHGSGLALMSLAAAVRGVELVGPDGSVRWVTRGDPDFDGSVVSLGSLGIVTRLELDVEPTYDVRQLQFTGLAWDVVAGRFREVMGSAYSISLFTRWTAPEVDQVWVKSRTDDGRPEPGAAFFGAVPAEHTLHMIPGASPEAVTRQHGVTGPWHRRLPHFRPEFTPSAGHELQTEYLLPIERAAEACRQLRALGALMAPVLQIGEIRTIAADDLWLSGAQGRDTVGFHFTWTSDQAAVYDVLPHLEEVLLPLDARPHWGKCFTVAPEALAVAYPRLADFVDLRDRVDPAGKFSNDYLDRLLGAAVSAHLG